MSGPLTRLLLSADGRVLDSEINGTEHARYIDVILESRSGARGSDRERNPDYLPALTVLLEGLAALGARIEDIQIVSRPALMLPEEDRRLPLGFPLELSPKTNFVALRSRITETQRGVARGLAASKTGGNNNKRLLLRISRNAAVPDAHALRLALVTP